MKKIKVISTVLTLVIGMLAFSSCNKQEVINPTSSSSSEDPIAQKEYVEPAWLTTQIKKGLFNGDKAGPTIRAWPGTWIVETYDSDGWCCLNTDGTCAVDIIAGLGPNPDPAYFDLTNADLPAIILNL